MREQKIPMEVNAGDNVGELRKELAKILHMFHVSLPQEDYFLIYKHPVIDDDRLFRWHHVDYYDTIVNFKRKYFRWFAKITIK